MGNIFAAEKFAKQCTALDSCGVEYCRGVVVLRYGGTLGIMFPDGSCAFVEVVHGDEDVADQLRIEVDTPFGSSVHYRWMDEAG